MIERSGVLDWISGTLLWLDKRDSLENIKIADRWEKDYYEVISQKPNGIPIFVIRSLGKDKR